MASLLAKQSFKAKPAVASGVFGVCGIFATLIEDRIKLFRMSLQDLKLKIMSNSLMSRRV